MSESGSQFFAGRSVPFYPELADLLAYLPKCDLAPTSYSKIRPRGMNRALIVQQLHHRLVDTTPDYPRLYRDDEGLWWLARHWWEWRRWDFTWMEEVTMREAIKDMHKAKIVTIASELDLVPPQKREALMHRHKRVALTLNYEGIRAVASASKDFEHLVNRILFFVEKPDPQDQDGDPQDQDGDPQDQDGDPQDQDLGTRGNGTGAHDHEHSIYHRAGRNSVIHERGGQQSPETGSVDTRSTAKTPERVDEPQGEFTKEVFAQMVYQRLTRYEYFDPRDGETKRMNPRDAKNYAETDAYRANQWCNFVDLDPRIKNKGAYLRRMMRKPEAYPPRRKS